MFNVLIVGFNCVFNCVLIENLKEKEALICRVLMEQAQQVPAR